MMINSANRPSFSSTNVSMCLISSILNFIFKVLQQKLEQATKSKIYLIKKLDKSREEVEDLKFQVKCHTVYKSFVFQCYAILKTLLTKYYICFAFFIFTFFTSC